MLASKENVLAALQVDLSTALRFAAGWVVVTSERLLACDAGTTAWRSWPLGDGLALKLQDHGGVGSLELHSPRERLALWRFTLAHHAQALRLLQRFEQQSARGDNGAEDEADEPACPTCHTPLPPDTEECPACARAQPPQTSTWVLLRLWRFARPYRKQLAAGFALTLASTAATLVPPYLTIPLMDDILIPFQNGKQIEPGLVLLYLSGLLLSALAAWGLSWARTYILALVSERIGADLRTTTYEHLLRLSLDYFGGKRTGDLMARIGSETDRINVFLSLHALDFVTDVLMIMMTAAILFSINPWLALVTLVPLPFIGWMIHTVRDRLRTGFEKIDRVWSEVTNVLADTIPGIRVVKAFAQEKREAQRFRDANQHNLEVNDKLNKTWSLFTPTVSLLTEIGLLVVWGFGIWLVSRNQITVGVDTNLVAEGAVTLLAGQDRDFWRNKSFVTARADLFNHAAVPVSVNPDVKATLNLNNDVTVNGDAVRSGGTIQLGGIAGSYVVEGKGKVNDWTRDVGELVGISSEYGTSVKNLSSTAVLSGQFEAGFGNKQRLVIGVNGARHKSPSPAGSIQRTSSISAAGVTPWTRLAWPMVSGLCRLSFCCTSRDRPRTSA